MKLDESRIRHAVAILLVAAAVHNAPAGAETPVVRIVATQPATSEPRPDARIAPGEFTVSRDIAGVDPLYVSLKYGGSATPGSDYDPLPAQVAIPPGELSVVLKVVALSDSNASEGEENVAALLQPAPDGADQPYVLDPENWASVVIHDGPAVAYPPLITIQSFGATPEYCGPNMDCPGISFRLKRTESGLEEALMVLLRYEGTAEAGVDYEELPSSVTFAPGEISAHVESIAIDDQVDEGDETVVAVIDGPPEVEPPDQPAYRHYNGSNRAMVVLRENDGPPGPAIVTIQAEGFPAKTGEPCPVCLVAPVEVTVTRSGSLDEELSVTLQTGGTATASVDYQALPDPLVIPAGMAAASFLLNAIDDLETEGPEIVEIGIKPSPGNYTAGDPGSVYIVIGDDEGSEHPDRIDFVTPSHGAAFPSGTASISIRALAVSSRTEIDRPTQFFANGELIGESHPPQYGRPYIPCLPREHDMVWDSPPDGQYILTARVEVSLDEWIEAPPIEISVGPVQERPVVSIVATERIAEEDSAPTLRPFVYRGQFTISRTGNSESPLTVYLHVSGTAVPDIDYAALPFAVSLPEGVSSAAVTVEAIPDKDAEPLETVIAELSNCPPDDLSPPCYDFEIDASYARDTVFVRDDGVTRATLEITAPEEGQQLLFGAEIGIDCTAIDIDGAITAVDFYADDKKIGESRIEFVVEPPPGTPVVHNFTWTDAALGGHTLTARAFATGNLEIRALPVNVVVAAGELPVIVVTPLDAFAAEPDGESPPNQGTFRLRRSGPATQELGVNYSMGGSAANGLDYVELSGGVFFPAGEESVDVVLEPFADNLTEMLETAVLQVELQFDDGPERYRVGEPSRAVVVIGDRIWRSDHAVDAACAILSDGSVLVSFPAETAAAYRVEASGDLLTWITIHEALAVEDAVHFVDPGNSGVPQQFYRLVRKPAIVEP